MDPVAIGPLDWFNVPANGQGLMFALVSSMCIAVAVLLYKTAGLLTVLSGVVTAILLTSIAIPLASLYFHLAWPWWPLIGCFNGAASLRVIKMLDAFAANLERRLPDAAADRVTSIVRGSGAENGGNG